MSTNALSLVEKSPSPNWVNFFIVIALLAIGALILSLSAIGLADHVAMATTQTLTHTSEIGTIQVMLTPTEGGCNFNASFSGSTIPAFSKQGKFDGPCDFKSALTALLGQFLTDLEANPQPDLWLEHKQLIDFIASIIASL